MMSKAVLIKKAEPLGIETKGLTVAELETAIAAETALQPKQPGTDGAAGDGDAGTGADGDDQGSDPEGDAEAGNPDSEPGTGAAGDSQTSNPDGDADNGAPGDSQGGGTAPDELKTSFEYRGVEYVFKKTAPERFNFLKQNRTQQEWLQDEDAMELLVTGNSHFVKPLKK